MKNTKIDLQTNPTLQRQSVACNIPVAQLVGEVYEGASPPVQNQMLAQLVGQVYETAATAERARLLEQLLHPLGVFALLAVANGIFARIRFRAGWQAMQIRMEDAVEVRASDVSALIEYLQKAGFEAFDSLSQLLSSPACASGSAAAAVMASVLLQCIRKRRSAGPEFRS